MIISIMVLIIIVSTIMIATGVSYLMLLKYETASTSSTRRFMMKYMVVGSHFAIKITFIALLAWIHCIPSGCGSNCSWFNSWCSSN